jgi:hypothetical protein
MELLKKEEENRTDYTEVINYLMKSLQNHEINKDENFLSNNLIKETLPVFIYEFFVFDLYTPKEILKIIKQPLLAFRFLHFPTQTLEGQIDLNKEAIHFNQGKSCFFEMEIHQLKENLQNEPLYIMFIDMNYGDMKILGSTRVNVSIFGFDHFAQWSGSAPPHPRRNILKLFDSVSTKVAEFDLSLLIRREYFRYESKKDININENLLKQNQKKEILIQDPNTCKVENLIPESDKLQYRQEIIKELKTMKKEAGVNTNLEVRKNETYNNNSNQIQGNQHKKLHENFDYVTDIKKLLEKEKNPPPLYFYNKRQPEMEKVIVKVIHENQPDKNSENSYIPINQEPLINSNFNSNRTQLGSNESQKNIQYVKLPVNTGYSQKNKQSSHNYNKSHESKQKISKESYERKMREVNRYNSSTNSEREKNTSKEADTSKKFVEDEYENFEGNEYYNLFNKIKSSNSTSNKVSNKNSVTGKEQPYSYSKKSSFENNEKSLSLNNSKLSNNEINSENQIYQKSKEQVNNTDTSNKYEKDKFYEISNTHQFELSSNVQLQQSNQLVRSYNSFSVSNSNQNLEIKSNDKFNLAANKKSSIKKKLKFDKTDKEKENKSSLLQHQTLSVGNTLESISIRENSVRDNTEAIEEDIDNLSQSKISNNFPHSNTGKSSAKRKSSAGQGDITEEYNDFDYDHITEETYVKYNNRLSSYKKDESEIEEEI